MRELTGEAIALRQGRATNAMLVFAKGTDHDERAKKLMKIKAELVIRPDHFQMGWQRIWTAPFDRHLELAVIDA